MIAAFAFDALCLMGVTGLGFWLSVYDPAILDGQEPRDAKSLAIAMGYFLSSLVYLVAYITGAILFFVWLVRANKNARALGSHGMEFTPGWSVGWFFVPIVNLFLPYQAITEIYEASDPEGDADSWRGEAPGFFLAWWLSWIGLGFCGLVASASQTMAMLAAGLSVVAAFLAARVILAIESRQVAKHRRGPIVPPGVEPAFSNRFL